MLPTLDIDALVLAKGSHDGCNDGMCLYEAYNVITRSEHTDDCPPDVSQVLHTFGMRLNDCLPDGRRQELKQFLPSPGKPSPLAGTRGDGLDEARGYMALDWLVRTYTPAWLDLAGLSDAATELRGLRRIADLVAAHSAGPVVRSAREQAAAAWAAAGAAAGDAAWDAAWDAARDAAWAAARDAAGAAARAAARDAAGAAARAAARAAAGAAARAAAGAAAGDAAGAAAGDAARAELQPTVDQLQTSAIELLKAMLRP